MWVVVEGLNWKSPHPLTYHSRKKLRPSSFLGPLLNECLIASFPDLTHHNLAPSIFSVSTAFHLSLSVSKLSSSLRRSHTEVSWRWADTLFHNFPIWVLCSWHRPTHSAEQRGQWRPLVTHSVVTFYSPCWLQVMLGFFNTEIGLITSLQLHIGNCFHCRFLKYTR